MNKKEKILELKARKEIYNVILKYPGIHLSEIFRALNLSESTIRYHIRYLEKSNLVMKKSEKGYTRFYVVDKICNQEKKLLSLFRRQTPRNIILFLLVDIHSSQVRLSKVLEISPKAVEQHLKKMVEMNIIEAVKVDNGVVSTRFKSKLKKIECELKPREVVYQLVDPYLIYDFMMAYKEKLLDMGLSDSIIRLFNFQTQVKPTRKRKTILTGIDNALDAFFDVFPLPFRI
jgi:predicted transcriptional regulator